MLVYAGIRDQPRDRLHGETRGSAASCSNRLWDYRSHNKYKSMSYKPPKFERSKNRSYNYPYSKGYVAANTTTELLNLRKSGEIAPPITRAARAGVLMAMAAAIAISLSIGTANAQLGALNSVNSDTTVKVFTIFVDGAVTSDSNLFRRPAQFAQSETILSSNLGVRYNKAFGQQEFNLEAVKSLTRYEKFSYLDFDATNYKGYWNWQVNKRLSGKISAFRSENLAPFENTAGLALQRNVRVIETQAADFDFWAIDGFHIIAGLTSDNQKSEQSSILNRAPDFDSTGASLGIKYIARSGNSITGRWHKTDGQYTNNPVAALNTDYVENMTELSADWKLSGHSALNAKIGWLDRTGNGTTRRNFSGPSSSASYVWESGGKLGATLSAARKTSPLQDLVASYREDTTLSIATTWRTSEKTSAFMTLSSIKGKDLGGTGIPGIGNRRDTTNSISAGVTWVATRTLSINGSLQQAKRTANVPLTGYDASVARIGAAISF